MSAESIAKVVADLRNGRVELSEKAVRVLATRSMASETMSHPGQPPTLTRVGGKSTLPGTKGVPARYASASD